MNIFTKTCNLKGELEQRICWDQNHFSKLTKLIIPVENSKWGRLLCTWHEKKSDGTQLHHTYSALLNVKTLEMYIDCRPQKIFAKALALLVARPVHILFKTLYHVSLAGVAYEFFKGATHEQSKRETLINSAKSLADIIRIPLYGIAMIITNIAGLILGLVCPTSLYDTREILGKLEESLNWGTRRTLTTLAPCFQPISLLALTDSPPLHHEDSIYYLNDSLEIGLSNFARWAIRLRRRKYNCFDQIQGTLDPNRIYISNALEIKNYFQGSTFLNLNPLPSSFFDRTFSKKFTNLPALA